MDNHYGYLGCMKTIISIIPNSKNRPTFGLQRARKLNLQDFEGSWFRIWTLSLHPLQRTCGHMGRFTFLLDSPSALLGGGGLVPRAVRPWIHILSCKLRERTLGLIKPMRFPILLLQLPSSKWRRTKNYSLHISSPCRRPLFPRRKPETSMVLLVQGSSGFGVQGRPCEVL